MIKRKKSILIVDDVELNRAILHDLFCCDFDILEAENGEEAIRVLDESYRDLSIVFLDIVMPIKDGFAVMEHMLTMGYMERLPVFLITAENSDELINRGYDMGAVDIIQKPFNPTIIRRRVGNTIELYKARFQMQSLIAEQSKELVEQSEKLRRFSEMMIDALSTAIEFRDCESGEHIRRVRGITRVLLNGLAARYRDYGLTDDSIEQISLASAMHDIGKIAIPDSILNKPGQLTPEEFAIMRQHTVRGCELMKKIDSIRTDEQYRYYHDICRWHHEKWDGKGYPDGLKGEQIPIWAQVVAVADCYDALVSERVYKKAYNHQDAIRMILEGECGQFNPRLMEILQAVESQLEHAAENYGAINSSNLPKIKYPKAATTDVSDRALRLIEMERERYRQLMELSNEAIFTYFPDTRVLEQSNRMIELFGGASNQIFEAPDLLHHETIHPDDRAGLRNSIEKLGPELSSLSMDIRLTTKRRQWEWFKLRLSTSWDVDNRGHCMSLIGRLRSIDALKREIMQWKNQANVDALTGILNRYGLTAAIEQLIGEGERKQRFALFMLDVDNFKRVNDTHGHLYGDKILSKVADTLRETMRAADIVGRIGGDEFVVVMKDIESPEIAAKKASEICERIEHLGRRDGLGISASIGVVLYPRNGYSFKVLLEKADKALYTVKQNDKGGVKFYTSAMEARDYITMITQPDQSID